MRQLDLVIFDLDGTLIDSKLDIAACVNATLAKYHEEELPLDVIVSYVGVGVQPLLRGIFKKAGLDEEAALVTFDQIYENRLIDKTTVYAGVTEMLRHFEKTPKVVLTNKKQRFADPIVTGLKLKPFFEGIYGREAFGAYKPDPLPVQEVCARYDVLPQRAAIVGDTETDIAAGKGAGIVTIAALYGYGDNRRLTEMRPDHSIAGPRDLLNIIQ